MGDSNDVVNNVVVPLIGLCTAHILFLSPMRELLKVDKSQALGDLNVFPLAMISVNCFAWTGYAIVKSNLWIFLTNFPSVMIGLFYMTIMTKCADLGAARLNMIRIITCAGLAFDGLGLLLMIALTGEQQQAARENIMGTICIIVLVIFYVAPLSTLAQVLKTKDSSAFFLPLALTTAINGAIWTAFGVYNHDAFVYGPNALGAVNGTVQVICCLVFPRKPAKQPLAMQLAPNSPSKLKFHHKDDEFAIGTKFDDDAYSVATASPTGSMDASPLPLTPHQLGTRARSWRKESAEQQGALV
ncbi:sugar efflux transporter for intercellular exchange-domain-containing protein [Tribonema minus]|uniref:Sugar transporter SWEET1 n=1 Tax=Tribonema minus TaxID=303371 RepID=A0A836C8A8_9STRA|nr:sugar efflux transporter for intercellular exchange-domain-containing protein [Tribonema minus]